jgi:hypothetical protein
MDWGRIQKRDAGTAAAALINPVHDKPNRNYMKQNLNGLKEQAKQVREKREEAALPGAKAFKMKQFEGIAGKVQKEAVKPPPPDQKQVVFIKKGEGKMAQPILEPREEPRVPRQLSRPSVPAAADVVPAPKIVERKFIAENRVLAEEHGKMRRAAEQDTDAVAERIKRNFGKVPTYLKGIKNDLEEKKRQEELRNQKEDVPPGYRILPESERLEMLAALKEKHAEAEDKYKKLPLRVDTERAKKAQADLEKKIDELEKAVAMFSKPKVLLEL